MARYEIREESQSAHCCFEATVVDTTKLLMIGGPHYNDKFDPVCECFDLEYAKLIADALNCSAGAEGPSFDMLAHLQRQRDFSERTFGPGPRVSGLVDHIRKELQEIEADPGDLNEWIDVAILALDGAWRSGASPQQIVDALVSKQTKNEGRTWPDWRTAPADKAIEHDRSGEAP